MLTTFEKEESFSRGVHAKNRRQVATAAAAMAAAAAAAATQKRLPMNLSILTGKRIHTCRRGNDAEKRSDDSSRSCSCIQKK